MRFTVMGNVTTNVTQKISHVTFLHIAIIKTECNPGDYGLFLVKNANINLSNCLFEDICNAVELQYEEDEIFSASIHSCEFLHVNLVIYSKVMKNGRIFIHAANIVGTARTFNNGSSYAVSLSSFDSIYLSIKDSIIRQTDEGISINVRSGAYLINITSAIFAENVGQGIIATFDKGVYNNVSKFVIEKVQFVRNKGVFASAINLFTKEKIENTYVDIDHCQFYQNEAETFFGTIYVDGVHVHINNSLFINNVAGKLHETIQGFGGAIYIEAKTIVKVFHSKFINNTCSGFGGTIFSRGDFHCINCSFVGPSDILVRPLLGDILYATAGLRLVNTKWVSTVMTELPKPFIWHPGSPTIENWKIIVDGYFKATCPEGHNMTSSGVKRNSYNSNGRISVSCNPCPLNEYSLMSGSLSLSHENGMVETLKENSVHCYHCKYGGVCSKGSIRAQANYYGYKTGARKEEVHFISCPVGYCCKGNNCKKFNSCQANRRGELCGKCKKGLSENVINANCIETSKCTDDWFWWIYIPCGVIYILSFMYLDKISQFVKHQLIWWDNKIHLRHDLAEYDIIDVEELGEQVTNDNVSGDTNEKNMPHKRTINSIYDRHNEENDDINQPQASSTECTNKDIFNQTKKGVRGPDIFTDILNLSFYFYQMFILLRMRESIVLTQILMGLKSLYSSIFTLSIEGHNSFLLCPIPRLNAIGKMLLMKSFTLYILCLLLVFHMIIYLVQRIYEKDVDTQKSVIVFSVRLKVATIQIILIGYATLTTTSLTLLNCVPVNNKSVLLLDGTVECYEWWQFIIFVFFVLWIIPFPFIMVYSLVHLKKEIIDYRSFILVWVVPMFYILYILCSKCVRYTCKYTTSSAKQKATISREQTSGLSEEKLSVREILFRLESPFKGDCNHFLKDEMTYTKQPAPLHEPAFWQGAMIGRRLALILVMTFINAPVSRLYCALFLCIIYLIHQVYYRPYVKKEANLFEIMTSAILIIFCSMNLFFAYSYVSDITPEAADEHLTIIFRVFEAAILVFIPTVVMVILIVLVITRICTLIFKCIKTCVQKYCKNERKYSTLKS